MKNYFVREAQRGVRRGESGGEAESSSVVGDLSKYAGT